MKSGFRIIDSDIHVLEPLDIWQSYLDPQWRDRAPTPPRPDTTAWMTLEGKSLPAWSDTPERMRAMKARYQSRQMVTRIENKGRKVEELAELMDGTSPESMLGAMDVEGVDVAVAFRTFAGHLIGFDDQDPAFAAALCRAFNRWLNEFCSADPSRLRSGMQISLHDPQIAADEARIAVEDLGATTLVLPSHPVNGRRLYDRYYDPFWSICNDLGLAVSFHGIHASYCEGSLANAYLDNLVIGHAMGQPVQLMAALAEIIAGGVAARHPDIRFAFLEGNCGWLGWWLFALDQRWKEWGDRELFEQTELPSELFSRQCFIAMDVDEDPAADTIARVGDDNIVLSTDWPHDDSAFPHAIDEFLALYLPDDSKRKILWDNCARLYAIDNNTT